MFQLRNSIPILLWFFEIPKMSTNLKRYIHNTVVSRNATGISIQKMWTVLLHIYAVSNSASIFILFAVFLRPITNYDRPSWFASMPSRAVPHNFMSRNRRPCNSSAMLTSARPISGPPSVVTTQPDSYTAVVFNVCQSLRIFVVPLLTTGDGGIMFSGRLSSRPFVSSYAAWRAIYLYFVDGLQWNLAQIFIT